MSDLGQSDFRRIAVLDIGKTNAKVVVVDAISGGEVAAVKMANAVLQGPPYPHYDIDRIWSFALDALARFAVEPGYDAISITTHGACAALLDADGELAMPVLDYEHSYPQHIRDAYADLRPSFTETASPQLSAGLNLGAQLHYLKESFPAEFSRVATILTYPQYWACRLTGTATNEVTSLGCHTDLWQPGRGEYSRLVDTLGIRPLMAPVQSAFDRLGHVLPSVAERIGLAQPVPVFCGIHDSNASLLPHLLARRSPFSVVSTGTWVVSFAVGGNLAGLDASRDTLANVDALGRAVPSSRFMGGREYEMLTLGWKRPADDEIPASIEEILLQGRMLLPTVVHGSGPFPGRVHAAVGAEARDAAEAHALASIYVALMTDVCLSLVGAAGETIVEGPLADNMPYLQLLAALTGRDVLAVSGSTGTSAGAALLTGVGLPPPVFRRIEPWPMAAVSYYQKQWLQNIAATVPA
ncbi:carbohydrate kinase [Rhizobiales bacterium RZME27]|uniref:Carbohydrate kinase n=1 Tax=Endobacterium cereale TaxID=2663029 RepID=A0A6A8AAN1_9HYPH|nr:FGGY-family carbohydrate kinase [Endobacterium cereale]MEB2847750.1 FGGY-family carbohydrate kinase [Endobacterium cereale]MQY47789.1 carbohydrate kinase [Endobacterium cereale]